MVKQLNGVFRGWLRVEQSDAEAPPIIWGHCIVHFSNPEFSGRVLHTSGLVAMTDHRSFKVAETRNNFYALIGPEYPLPKSPNIDPKSFLEQKARHAPRIDAYAGAAINAAPDCEHCRGSGVIPQGTEYFRICQKCCKHHLGWWLLEGGYGPENGRWACKAGCGAIVDEPKRELEFLPQAGM